MNHYSSLLDQGIRQSKGSLYQQAMQSFSKAIDLNPSSKLAYLNHGALCNQSGLFDVAIEDFTVVVQIDPWDIPAYFNRFLAHLGKMEHPTALKDLCIAVSLATTRKGEASKRMETFGEALRIVPNNARALLMRAKLHRERGEFQEAMKDLTMAVEFCPGFKEVYAERAALHRSLKNNQKCQEDIDKVIELSKAPSSPLITLIPAPFQMDLQSITSQLKERYREFMGLRNLLFSKNERVSSHLRVMRHLSQVQREAHLENSELYSQGNGSVSGFSKLEQVMGTFRKETHGDKEVCEDKESLNNSVIVKRGKRTRSDYSVDSLEIRGMLFSDVKKQGAGELVGTVGPKETSAKEDFGCQKQDPEREADLTNDKYETQSANHELKRSPTKTKRDTPKPKPSDEQNNAPIQILITSAKLHPPTTGDFYCRVQYGKNFFDTLGASTGHPHWGQSFTFQPIKSRGLLTLKILSPSSSSTDNLIGQAVIFLQDVSTKADLKHGTDLIGQIFYSITRTQV